MAEASSSSGDGITLLSFDLKPFTIPDNHKSGKCRAISEFNKICHIGEGAHGSVYKVMDTKTNETVALKKLKTGREEFSMLSLYCLREITIMKNLCHINIIQFYGVAVGKNFESTYLILEYCPFNLSKIIDDDQASLECPQIKCIMAQLFAGLAYIHDKYVLHRDLSVTNILFSAAGILKISDFGFARLYSTSEMTPNVVSRWYRAPEILFGSKKYTSAIDMWAAGCIFAELILKKPLFPGDSDNDMIKLITDVVGSPTETNWPGHLELPLFQSFELRLQPYNKLRQLFTDQPGTCVSLLHRLFVLNPSTRYTAKHCVQHTYFLDEPHACSLAVLVSKLRSADKI